jgi:hypothetical protein
MVTLKRSASLRARSASMVERRTLTGWGPATVTTGSGMGVGSTMGVGSGDLRAVLIERQVSFGVSCLLSLLSCLSLVSSLLSLLSCLFLLSRRFFSLNISCCLSYSLSPLSSLSLYIASRGKAYLGPAVDALPMKDNRLEPSLLFNTVFIRETNLLTPFFFSTGPGPSFAGALMAMEVLLMMMMSSVLLSVLSLVMCQRSMGGMAPPAGGGGRGGEGGSSRRRRLE